MTAVVTSTRPRTGFRWRRLAWALSVILGVSLLGAVAVWAYGPYWIAPVEDFTQGPGGAVAYVSLYKQLQEQAPQFWFGQDIHVTMTQSEFSGMLSSALLSGRRVGTPIQKVRASLLNGEIRVETVLKFQNPEIPERYRGPIGLKLRLQPVVTPGGLVRFRITRAAVGRIPIPTRMIQWAGRFFHVDVPGFNAQEPSIALPVGDLVASSLGRAITIKQVVADEGKLTLELAMPHRTVK